MDHQEYERHYLDFRVALYRTQIVTHYARKHIPNIEVNQPDQEKPKVAYFADRVMVALEKVSAGYRSDPKAVEALAGIVFHGEVERHICYQELPLNLAYLEAFNAHTLRAIWYNSPAKLDEVQPVRKCISDGDFATAAESSSEELESIVASAVRFMLEGGFGRYVDYLAKKAGLRLSANRRRLEVARLKRNKIIHNGGLIDENYLNKLNGKERKELKASGLGAGDPIPIDYSYVVDVYNDIVFLAEQVYVQVSKKYFESTKPLTEDHHAHRRQYLDMKVNPAESAVQQLIAHLGEIEETMAAIQELQRRNPSLSQGQALLQLIQKYLS